MKETTRELGPMKLILIIIIGTLIMGALFRFFSPIDEPNDQIILDGYVVNKYQYSTGNSMADRRCYILIIEVATSNLTSDFYRVDSKSLFERYEEGDQFNYTFDAQYWDERVRLYYRMTYANENDRKYQ